MLMPDMQMWPRSMAQIFPHDIVLHENERPVESNLETGMTTHTRFLQSSNAFFMFKKLMVWTGKKELSAQIKDKPAYILSKGAPHAIPLFQKKKIHHSGLMMMQIVISCTGSSRICLL